MKEGHKVLAIPKLEAIQMFLFKALFVVYSS